jgi:hypothetical protein
MFSCVVSLGGGFSPFLVLLLFLFILAYLGLVVKHFFFNPFIDTHGKGTERGYHLVK